MKTLVPVRPAVKAIDQQDQSGLYYPGTYVPIESLQTWTGYGLSSQAALNYIAVYQCIRVLANVFASLPLKVYRRIGDEGKAPATDHPLWNVLHLQPNSEMTSYLWRKVMMLHLLTWGNHFSEITRDTLGGLQLWPIRPDRMAVYWEGGVKVYDYLSSTGGRTRMRPGSIFHVQGQMSNGLIGSSPIADLRSTLSLSQQAERYGEATFKNGARPATVLSHPKTLSDPAIDRLAKQMDALRGAGNAGKTVVLEEDMKVTPIGFPPEDAQFMETRLMQHRLIYGAHGVPPHKVGDLERATFSNIEHQSLEFIQDGAMPWFVNFEQEAKVQLVEDDDVFVEFLVDGYLRGDSKTRAEAFAIRWQHGTLSPNQWRAKENENPIQTPDGEADPTGDLYYVPVNYAPTEMPEPPAPEPEPEEEEPPALPALLSVKGLATFNCPNCGKLINRLAAPGTVGYCGRCRAERTFAVA